MTSEGLVQIINTPLVNEGYVMFSGYRSLVQFEHMGKSVAVLEYARHQLHEDIARRYLEENHINFKLIDGPRYLSAMQRPRSSEGANIVKVMKVPEPTGENYNIAGMGKVFMNLPAMSFYSPIDVDNEYLMGVNRWLSHFFEQELIKQGWKKLD